MALDYRHCGSLHPSPTTATTTILAIGGNPAVALLSTCTILLLARPVEAFLRSCATPRSVHLWETAASVASRSRRGRTVLALSCPRWLRCPRTRSADFLVTSRSAAHFCCVLGSSVRPCVCNTTQEIQVVAPPNRQLHRGSLKGLSHGEFRYCPDRRMVRPLLQPIMRQCAPVCSPTIRAGGTNASGSERSSRGGGGRGG
jgi:hypothetical protein